MKDASKQTSIAKSTGNSVAINIKNINTLEEIEVFANYIANSDTYKGAFTRQEMSEDGNTIDVVNKADIVACIVTGMELGISPMQSVVLGRKLNREGMMKIMRGNSLGIDYVAALENIYTFKAGSREIIYTGIHIINKVLVDAGVKRTILDDGSKPYPYKFTFISKADKGNVFHDASTIDPNKVFIKYAHTTDAEMDEAFAAGKALAVASYTKRGLVELSRGDEVIAIPYTLEQAIEADLYKGVKADGTKVEGKNNWNAHPETHLIKMSIMLGARIIAAKELNGIYIAEEISSIKHDVDRNDYRDAEDAEVVD